MSRYIDAEKLEYIAARVYEKEKKNAPNREYEVLNQAVYDVLQAILITAPAEDVAPVVRCKDCKYRSKDTRWTRAGYCGRRGAGDFFVAPPDGYCSYGERKESNDENQT